MQELFRKVASKVSVATGSPFSFILAITIVILWASSGSFFNYSDTWQLVINTGTTIVTFLMVFLIQNTQNRDTRAVHIKLDELLKAMAGARTSLVNAEELSDEDLEVFSDEFRAIHQRYAKAREKRRDQYISKQNEKNI